MPPFTFTEEPSAKALLTPNVNVPLFTAVVPVYVFTPDSDTEPAVCLVNPVVPFRIAEMLPSSTMKVVELVSIPLVPVILPLVNVTALTVSVRVLIPSVPALTSVVPL